MKALIAGGGMSGLATAVNLLDLGIDVELVEADEIFGGRASSWKDEDGDMIDNALHVFFPYYVNLLNFLKKMGIEDNILWKQTEFYYMQEGGREAVLKFSNLPAPLHALTAFLGLLKSYKAIPRWKLFWPPWALPSFIPIRSWRSWMRLRSGSGLTVIRRKMPSCRSNPALMALLLHLRR